METLQIVFFIKNTRMHFILAYASQHIIYNYETT
jgi:hypothetical protein